jgi:hypothetical protein
MVSAAFIFYDDVRRYVDIVILIGLAVIEIVAFVNCLTQRSDAFAVVGSLSKPAWLGILGGAVLLTLLCFFQLPILAFVAITAAAIYLLDVRPALRDATDGSGSW